MDLLHLLFESVAKLSVMHGVRDFGIGHDLHHVVVRKPLGKNWSKPPAIGRT